MIMHNNLNRSLVLMKNASNRTVLQICKQYVHAMLCKGVKKDCIAT